MYVYIHIFCILAIKHVVESTVNTTRLLFNAVRGWSCSYCPLGKNKHILLAGSPLYRINGKNPEISRGNFMIIKNPVKER